MRILVCGGRDFNDYDLVKETLDVYKGRTDTIIHGLARGADKLGAKYAEENDITVVGYPALWETYGKRAGYERNARMLRDGLPDLVIAFPGGKGTQMMIDLAMQAGVPVERPEKATDAFN